MAKKHAKQQAFQVLTHDHDDNNRLMIDHVMAIVSGNANKTLTMTTKT